MTKPFELLLWQKRQAAIIYHFTTLEFLKEVQKRFNALLSETESFIDTAVRQDRDGIGKRDLNWDQSWTVDNWANGRPWGAMKDTQKGLAISVAQRAFEVYFGIDFYYLERMFSEYGTFWMSLDEQIQFDKDFKALCEFAAPMNMIIKDRRIDYWYYSYCWKTYGHLFPRLPKFRVRTDVEGESGKVPPRTGVYVAQDDPNAGLQFGWTGSYQGYYDPLPDAETFNELGLHAIQFIGRDNMWFNEAKMAEFCMLPQYQGILTYDNPPKPGNGTTIARAAEISRPSRWYFVEQLEGEWDDSVMEPVKDTPDTVRALPGDPVPRSGVWYTPALSGANAFLRLESGQALPDRQYTDWGQVIWYWLPEYQNR